MEAYVQVDNCPEAPQGQGKRDEDTEDYDDLDSEMDVFTWDPDAAPFVQVRSAAKRHPKTWVHYIAAEEGDWDYAPAAATLEDGLCSRTERAGHTTSTLMGSVTLALCMQGGCHEG